MRKDRERIVITGLGPISSLGIGKNETWENALSGKINLLQKVCKLEGEILDKSFLHQVRKFDLKNLGIDEHSLKLIDYWKEGRECYDLNYFLASIQLALLDSRLPSDLYPDNIGLVLTAESPGQGEFYNNFLNYAYRYIKKNNKQTSKKSYPTKKNFFSEFFNEFRIEGYDLQTFMNLFHVGRTFNLHGYSLQINNACASGLYALEAAADIIRSKKCSAVVVAAVDHPDVFKSLWFKKIGINPNDGKTKPFSKIADGFVLGEGGAALILESLEFARKRQANIYAEYLGGSFNMEGWKVTVPSPQGSYYKKVISNALSNCSVDVKRVDLIVPHGTASPIVDKLEIQAIENIFKSTTERLHITAFKPFVGHNLGGCTLVETALLLLCIQKKVILPVLNTCQFLSGSKLSYVKKTLHKKVNIAIKSCCAFAGFNAAVVFKNLE